MNTYLIYNQYDIHLLIIHYIILHEPGLYTWLGTFSKVFNKARQVPVLVLLYPLNGAGTSTKRLATGTTKHYDTRQVLPGWQTFRRSVLFIIYVIVYYIIFLFSITIIIIIVTINVINGPWKYELQRCTAFLSNV